MGDTEALHFSRLTPGRTVVGVCYENDRVAVAMLLDCAPEGGMFRDPQPAPLTLRQRIGCALAGWWPALIGFGLTSGWILLAMRAHH